MDVWKPLPRLCHRLCCRLMARHRFPVQTRRLEAGREIHGLHHSLRPILGAWVQGRADIVRHVTGRLWNELNMGYTIHARI